MTINWLFIQKKQLLRVMSAGRMPSLKTLEITMKQLFLAGLLLCTVTLSGCATMVRGTSEKLSITSTPSGAKVQLSDGRACITPCEVSTKRNKTLILTYSKKGCHSTQLTVVPSLAGSGVILGGLIDYGDGAVYDLQPNPANVMLSCKPTSKKK